MTRAELTAAYPRVRAIVAALFRSRVGRGWLRRLARAGGRARVEEHDLANDVVVALLQESPEASREADADDLDERVLRAVVEILVAGSPPDAVCERVTRSR